MLKISQSQMTLFEKMALKKSCTKILAQLNERFADKMDDIGDNEDQLEWVMDNAEKAMTYNIRAQGDVVRYLNTAITFGEDFDQLPWANAILVQDIEGATRTRLLQDESGVQLRKLLSEKQKKREPLIERKIQEYVKNKTEYVIAFTVFYGLPFETPADATPWLERVARKGTELGFVYDILLDSYLETAMYFGEHFYKQPWAEELLTREQSIHDKASALLDKYSEQMSSGH
ncbi:hypothetical protein MNBD_GAMMA11-1854 [hydrothermal vent metagenome]|uniref:Uncharacterized protein n=1 Tax=hydrothermal vent metagenome TaxID=652676 RepID=A0A3B0XCG1_9ZZZZ